MFAKTRLPNESRKPYTTKSSSASGERDKEGRAFEGGKEHGPTIAETEEKTYQSENQVFEGRVLLIPLGGGNVFCRGAAHLRKGICYCWKSVFYTGSGEMGGKGGIRL